MLVTKGNYIVIKTGGSKETPTDIQEPEFTGKAPEKVRANIERQGDQASVTRSTPDDLAAPTINTSMPNWDALLSGVMSSVNIVGISDTVSKQLEAGKRKSLQDWSQLLKQHFDRALSKKESYLPKRRWIHRDLYLRGERKSGISGLKRVVIAIDTSGSISHEQGITFLIEVADISKKFEIDELIIIYCSDSIDDIDVYKKSKKIDLTKWPTTGGNDLGFEPPFALLKERNIIPSVFIYFTDTHASFPPIHRHGIHQYKDKIFWFILGSGAKRPPFGTCLYYAPNGVRRTTLEEARQAGYSFKVQESGERVERLPISAQESGTTKDMKGKYPHFTSNPLMDSDEENP